MRYDDTPAKAAPRRQSGSQHLLYPHHRRTIEDVVPRHEDVDDFIVLAAMVYHPDWAGHFVEDLKSSNFQDSRHQQFVRAGLWQLAGLGGIDLTAIKGALIRGRVFHEESWTLHVRILQAIADLLIHFDIVEYAIKRVTGRRLTVDT